MFTNRSTVITIGTEETLPGVKYCTSWIVSKCAFSYRLWT